jgi:hypothetical protein
MWLPARRIAAGVRRLPNDNHDVISRAWPVRPPNLSYAKGERTDTRGIRATRDADVVAAVTVNVVSSGLR